MPLPPPSPPGPPGAPSVPPANVLLFAVDLPRPGYYQINLACGDVNSAVSNQQIVLYDGSTAIATLFTGKSAPANSFVDAQGNILSAAQWPLLNRGVVFIFQTTQAVFYIGDGATPTYLASLQIQDATRQERPFRMAWQEPEEPWTSASRKFGIFQPPFKLSRGRPPAAAELEEPWAPRPRQLGSLVSAFIKPLRPRPIAFEPELEPWFPRERGPSAYTPVAFKPPLVIPFRALKTRMQWDESDSWLQGGQPVARPQLYPTSRLPTITPFPEGVITIVLVN